MTRQVVQELLVKFGGDAAGLKKASTEASTALNSLQRTASVAGAAVKAFIPAALASSIVNLGRSTLSWADDLQDLSDVVGLTTERLQELNYTAAANGGNVDQLTSAMSRFTTAIGDAYVSGGPLVDRLRELDIRALDSTGSLRDMDSLLYDVADAIKNAATEQEKLSIATDFFGRQSAPGMVRMLGNGSEGLREFADRANEAGAVLSKEMIEKAAKTNEQFELLSLQLGQNFKSAILSSIEAIKPFAIAIDTIYSKMSGLADVVRRANENMARSRGVIYAEPNTDNGPYAEPNPEYNNTGGGFIPQKETAKEAKIEFDNLNSSLKYQRELMEELKLDTRDTFKEMVMGAARGQSALETLNNVASRVLSSVADSLFSMAFGGGSGGGIGGLIGGSLGKLFGGVTATSGPMAGQTVFPTFNVGGPFETGINRVPNDMLAMVHKGERIIPARDAGKSNGTNVVQNINIGNGVQQIVRAEVQRMLPMLSQAAVGGVKNAQMRGM